MKLANFIMLIVLSLLAACGPGAGNGNPTAATQMEEAAETSQNSLAATPTTKLTATPVATPSPVRADNTGDESQMELNWNTDPDTLIVSATFCCGHTPNVAQLNYIPDALIWGDGRIIWVESADSGERRVLEGQLTPDQMHDLGQRVAGDGFFDWQDSYVDRSVADAAEQCLSVELEQQSKKVCEYFDGAPQAFHDLYAYIAHGAGAAGKNYAPEIGYLTAHPLALPENFTPPATQHWPAATLGLSLGQTEDGVWIEGEVLELAWSVVNANWLGIAVQEEDAYYQISVQIPGLSYVEP